MKKTASILLIILTSLLFGSWYSIDHNKNTRTAKNELASKIETYIQGHLDNNRFNGTLFISKGDTVIFHKSYGYANQQFKLKNKRKTKYLIGSITKPFTAYAILLLEEAGKLGLQDKLSNYFPAYPNSQHITIEQLLTHTAGIPDYHLSPTWKKDGQQAITPNRTLDIVSKLPARFKPGTRFEYSNSGYIILGLLIEQVSKQTFEEYIQEHIIYPLDLKNTGIVKNETYIRNLAQGYRSSPQQSKIADYINYQQPFTSGNMYSTPQDLWIFTKAVMNSRQLSEKKTKEIFTKNKGRYGYGWGIRKKGDRTYYGHHGGMNGFVGSISYLPEDDYFICFLKNDENAPWYTLANDLVDIVQGKNVLTPEKEKRITLSEEKKKHITGNYLIKPGDTLSVYQSKNELFMQETGQRRHQLFPIENNRFVFTQLEFMVTFSDRKENRNPWLKFTGAINLKATKIKSP